MSRLIDLTGKKFGKLTVIHREDNKNGKPMWLCQCECGNRKIIAGSHLREGVTKSCGCLYSESALNISGNKFGKLTAKKPVGKNKKGQIIWLCKCDCGKMCEIPSSSLVSGNSKSCGCSRRKNGEIHNHRLYNIWRGMKNRCYNSSHMAYENYGGRGIEICEEWKNDFQTFYKWAVENGYSDNLTIDRINNDGNYEPNNCRWITQKEQCNNTRRNIYVTCDGKTNTISEWIRVIGVSRRVMENRIKKCGHQKAVEILVEERKKWDSE